MSTTPKKRASSKAVATAVPFVDALCRGLTVEEAAKEVGVSRSTGWRWSKSPEVKQMLAEVNRCIFEAIGRGVAARSRGMAKVLEGIANDPEQDGRARVQAARTFLEFAIKFRMTDLEAKLEAQIAALEQRLIDREQADTESEQERKRHGS